jgi:hypothetical protein
MLIHLYFCFFFFLIRVLASTKVDTNTLLLASTKVDTNTLLLVSTFEVKSILFMVSLLIILSRFSLFNFLDLVSSTLDLIVFFGQDVSSERISTMSCSSATACGVFIFYIVCSGI